MMLVLPQCMRWLHPSTGPPLVSHPWHRDMSLEGSGDTPSPQGACGLDSATLTCALAGHKVQRPQPTSGKHLSLLHNRPIPVLYFILLAIETRQQRAYPARHGLLSLGDPTVCCAGRKDTVPS